MRKALALVIPERLPLPASFQLELGPVGAMLASITPGCARIARAGARAMSKT